MSRGPVAAGIEIVFDVNNSFLPEGAIRQLERLASALGRDHSWQFELRASVGRPAGGQVTGRAARWARFLADRRLQRVAEWLERRPELKEVRITPVYTEADQSRRVVVLARELGRPAPVAAAPPARLGARPRPSL